MQADGGVRSGNARPSGRGSGSEPIPRTLRIPVKDFPWFSPRGYRHFDRQVGTSFAAKAMRAEFVAAHPFSPLIYYSKSEKRYKPALRKTRLKERPIMYASHRDACILSYYAYLLNTLMEREYAKGRIGDNVIAYRSLGKGNYHFAADVYSYALKHAPVAILAYDVKGFFDNLKHDLLKARLKRILQVSRLPDDWFSIYRFTTKFRYVKLDDLKANARFGEGLKQKSRDPIATIAQVKEAAIPIWPNPNPYGIPQGTPISAILSNLYMIDFDHEMSDFCDGAGALYRRYSDDILVVCSVDGAPKIQERIENLLAAEGLSISREKTEVAEFNPGKPNPLFLRPAQYLGFSLHHGDAAIRPSSLSRQWRKMRRSFRRTTDIAVKAMAQGKAKKIYTSKLRKRFTAVAARNFSSYARRSAKIFQSEKIMRQIRRFEKQVEIELRRLKEFEDVE